MNLQEKQTQYLNAKAIKGNSSYSIDEQGVSLPYEINFFTHPTKELNPIIHTFCSRNNRNELLLLDTKGNIWRYYTDIDNLQTTPLTLTEKVYTIEVIGETLIVQVKEHIEARSLSNGQLIWRKDIPVKSLLRKHSKSTLILYDISNAKTIILNVGGETLSIEAYQEEDFELASNELVLSKEIMSTEEHILLIFDNKLNANKLVSYTVEGPKWKIKKSLHLNNNQLLTIKKDTKGRIWYLSKEGKIGYFMKARQYLKAHNPLYFQIDSLKHNTRWHRLLMEYNIPAECNIRMEVAASNTNDKFNRAYAIIEHLNKDLLLPELEGQYLFVKIYLIGNQTYQKSPQISNIKIIYPRSTYLEYLPSYYQEDKKSSIMLEHFLSIFETVFSSLEKQSASSPSLIDSRESSKENLAWLSGWLGLTYDESWDENRWRILMHEAPTLFSIRGTREGIERIIEIYSDIRPLIQEPMHTHCLSQWRIVKKVNYRKWEKFNENNYKKVNLKKIDNYSFCVFLKPEQYKSKEEVNTIRRIVDEWKPAYTKARVVPLEHHLLLGSFIFLGINSKLEKRISYLGMARMPFESLSSANRENIRTLEHVRINNDAILN